ncbi:MAG: [NiFe]-hydrogenase assembly chaperone HybE [Azonexus sp.]|nr:[NiFe]-hydrogenase assembly chaperone HybE [Azonexus sp.]
MKIWQDNPSTALVATFAGIAATRMHGLPICNPRLAVEACGFRRDPNGHWSGVMLTPWAINLLCLPGQAEGWPPVASGGTCQWRYPSGEYEFIVADEASLGPYHLCSLFSPALEFESQDAALMTALAAAEALFRAPLEAPQDATPVATSRRSFLGLGR